MARSGYRTDNLNRLETEVSEVTSLLRDNVDKVVERGEKIDNLQSRSEDLEHGSSNFKQSAVRIRKKMWWKNCKMTCIIALVIFLIVGIIITIILVETKPWDSGDDDHHHAKTTRPTTITTVAMTTTTSS